jgi:hypothetical protein
MIRYTLLCDKRHEFESWFANSDAYDTQEQRGLVECPVCGTSKVKKALMRPSLCRGDRHASVAPPAEEEAPEAAQTRPEPAPAPAQSGEPSIPREQPAAPVPPSAPAPSGPSPAAATAPTGQAASATQPAGTLTMASSQEREFRRKLKELRDHLVGNAENVGPRFPEEARKMHYGEAEHRSIYGIASPEDAKQLRDEGIAFSPLPVLPEDRN